MIPESIHRVLHFTMQVSVLLGFSSAAQFRLRFDVDNGSWRCSNARPCTAAHEQIKNCTFAYTMCRHDSGNYSSCQV